VESYKRSDKYVFSMSWTFAFTDESMQLCAPENYSRIAQLIADTLNEDVTYSTKPIELRSQRVYAIKVITTRPMKMYHC
jgi:hypothetical protein